MGFPAPGSRFFGLRSPSLLLGLAALLAALLAGSAPGTQGDAELPPIPAGKSRTWAAKWIWTPGEAAPRNSYTHFRKSFRLDSVPKEARLFITADSRYRAWINGIPVSQGPARSDPRWQSYDNIEVGSRLRKGENTLAVLVHHIGETTFSYIQGRGGLLAELTGNSNQPLLNTDTTWKARRSRAWGTDPNGGHGQPRMSIQLDFNEVFDAREDLKDWVKPEVSDADWPAAVEVGPVGTLPWRTLEERDIPALRERPVAPAAVLSVFEAELPPRTTGYVSVDMAVSKQLSARRIEVVDPDGLLHPDQGKTTHVKTAPGVDAAFLIDFGREVAGSPRIELKGAKGGEVIDMGYGEVLHDGAGEFVSPASGKLGRLNPDRDKVHYADRYVCRPGDQVFRTFERRAFRYLELDVRNAPAGLDIVAVDVVLTTYPVEYRGAFRCSDERLNRIWEIGRWTCQLNMEDAFTDCPWRERAQWWGDARLEALISAYAFGDVQLIKRALRQHAQSLQPEGITWGVYPTTWDGGRLPTFTLVWVSTLWDTYMQTADRDLVRGLFPRVRYVLDRFFGPRVGAGGLLKDVPYWIFVDWADVETKGESAALNSFYFDALRSAAAMADVLGDAPVANEYRKRAADLRQAMNSRLWDAPRHVYRDAVLPNGQLSPKVSQQVNSLCVLYDIAPQGEQDRILDAIYSPGRIPGLVESGSPYFSFYQLSALYHAGRYDLALNEIRKRWGAMLDWGATTWWEMWKPGASFCHGWSGGPTFDLPSQYLGIRPLKAGWAEIEVTPRYTAFESAAGVAPSPKGDVEIAWQSDKAARVTRARVSGPKDVPLEIEIPSSKGLKVNKSEKLPAGVVRTDVAGGLRLRLPVGGELALEWAN